MLIAFVGQGAPLGDHTAASCPAMRPSRTYKNALASGEIETALEKIQSQNQAAILDVNFKSIDAGSGSRPRAEPVRPGQGVHRP